MRYILYFILIIIAQKGFSQTIINGKVISDIADVEGIIVLNNTTKVNTTTAKGGLFTIEARPNDILIIASPKLKGLEIKLNSNSFKMDPLIVDVKSKPHELAEVEIKSYAHINTISMGIVSKDVKTYTPAERRLRTASTGGPVGLIYNLISGEKAMLKKVVEVEKFEMNFQKLLDLLTEDFFLTTLKITKENLSGFLVFASEDIGVAKMIKDKDKSFLKLKLVELAFKFKELKNEN